MAKNDEGELEYILGNRQLISVFVIGVILLGVFFSMGYIVGRNSAMGSSDTARDSKSAAARWPQASDSGGKSADAGSPEQGFGTPEAPPVAPQASAKTARESAPSVLSTAPATSPAPAPAPPPAREPRSPASASRPSGTEQTASVTAEPAPGQYWQVVATARPDAEIITEALRKKGFHAVLAPAPKEGVFRVLVGPLGDAAAQAQIRTALESAGFKNPIIRKY
ncbi:MAG TPA: SPOR domain-containing protein [Bryobacteraceae bacterium]|nr:SPOR domain-containing protein [Bryobacteraceae bacterium]